MAEEHLSKTPPAPLMTAVDAYAAAVKQRATYEAYLHNGGLPVIVNGTDSIRHIGSLVSDVLKQYQPTIAAELLERLKASELNAKIALFEAMMADPPRLHGTNALPEAAERILAEVANLMSRVYGVKVWVVTQNLPQQDELSSGGLGV